MEILKQTASEILQNGNMLDIKINKHFYKYILNIIDTKTYKFKQITPKKTHEHICIVKFDNKALEATRVLKIFNHPDIKTLPYNLQKKGSIPTVTYKLGNTLSCSKFNVRCWYFYKKKYKKIIRKHKKGASQFYHDLHNS